MITPLSVKEKSRFNICKKQIRDGLQTCFDTGSALIEIRDSKLYREEFETFKEFCQQTYQIGESYAYRLIESSEIKNSPIGEFIQNEAQARAISKVPEEDRKTVLKIADKSGDVTAAAIAVAAEQVVGKLTVHAAAEKLTEKAANAAPSVDEVGYSIPKECLQYFQRSGEIQELLTAVSRIKAKLEAKRAEDDVLFRNISQAVVNELAMAYSFIANAKPYAVCLNCQGKLKDSCRACKGTGFMSKFAYEHEQVKGLRTIREMAIAKGNK